MDILHIIFMAIQWILSLAVVFFVIIAIIGNIIIFSPAIIGITLGGLLWSEGYDNIAVIIIFFFSVLQVVWADMVKKWDNK